MRTLNVALYSTFSAVAVFLSIVFCWSMSVHFLSLAVVLSRFVLSCQPLYFYRCRWVVLPISADTDDFLSPPAETHSSQWYSWGAAHLGGRLCAACWDRWKKYGGVLKPSAEETGAERPPSAGAESEHSASSLVKLHRCPAAGCPQEFRQRGQLIRHAANAHGLLLPGTGSSRPVTRTRPSFFLAPTPMTRLSRRLCRHLIKPRRAARTPIHAINVAAIRAECEWPDGGGLGRVRYGMGATSEVSETVGWLLALF